MHSKELVIDIDCAIGRAGGDWHTTYAPSPHYLTSDMNSLFLEGYELSVFDLTQPDCVQVQVSSKFDDRNGR